MESMAINDPYYETEAAFLILEKFEINATDKNPKNQITLMQIESCLKLSCLSSMEILCSGRDFGINLIFNFMRMNLYK